MTHRPVTRIAAVGDLFLGDSPISVGFGLRSRYPGRALANLVDHVKPLFAGQDIVFGNLETPLTRIARGTSRWQRDQIRGDPEYAAILRAAGFTAVSVANNHMLQHGCRGFDDTIAALEGQSILPVGLRGTDGWCSGPAFATSSSGARVGMLGYCWRPRQHGSGEVPYAEGSSADAVADVERLRGNCDAILVSLHWGEDFVDQPSADEIATARALVQAGASIIVGHHPQVRRPIELFRGSVIAYSLGNFIADLVWLDAFREGTILYVERDPTGTTKSRITATRLSDHFSPVVTHSMIYDQHDDVVGLTGVEYRAEADRMLHVQRRAAYRYALKHLTDYPVRVLADLGVTTLRNKLGASRQRRHDEERQ